MRRIGRWWLPDDDRYFEPFLRNDDGFQLDRLGRAMRHVTRFKTAVDVGAHIGTWAMKMSESFDMVFAFEPAADTYECLKLNTAEMQNVAAIHAAVGDEERRMAITDDAARPGNTGSRYVVDGDDVDMVKLDDMTFTTLDLLKLDVEGYERRVLIGAGGTILRHGPVVIIEVKGFGDRYGERPEDAVDLLRSWGYKEVERMGKDRVLIH